MAEKEKIKQPSLNSQERLAEILNNSPRLVSLNGTEWEVRALKMGTQNLIANEVIKIKKSDTNTYGDVVSRFAENIPAMLNVITLALLNNKNKIFKDGDEEQGHSSMFNDVRNTLEWECDVSEFGNILVEILQMLDISFFFQLTELTDIFRANTTEKRRMMKTKVQK